MCPSCSCSSLYVPVPYRPKPLLHSRVVVVVAGRLLLSGSCHRSHHRCPFWCFRFRPRLRFRAWARNRSWCGCRWERWLLHFWLYSRRFSCGGGGRRRGCCILLIFAAAAAAVVRRRCEPTRHGGPRLFGHFSGGRNHLRPRRLDPQNRCRRHLHRSRRCCPRQGETTEPMVVEPTSAAAAATSTSTTTTTVIRTRPPPHVRCRCRCTG